MTVIERILVAVIVCCIVVGAALLLSGCQSYQPPGQDLWLGVQQMERAK